jgi:hypothetical protein
METRPREKHYVRSRDRRGGRKARAVKREGRVKGKVGRRTAGLVGGASGMARGCMQRGKQGGLPRMQRD